MDYLNKSSKNTKQLIIKLTIIILLLLI